MKFLAGLIFGKPINKAHQKYSLGTKKVFQLALFAIFSFAQSDDKCDDKYEFKSQQKWIQIPAEKIKLISQVNVIICISSQLAKI